MYAGLPTVRLMTIVCRTIWRGAGAAGAGGGAVSAASCCGGNAASACNAAICGSGTIALLAFAAVQSGQASVLQTMAVAKNDAVTVNSFVRGNFVKNVMLVTLRLGGDVDAAAEERVDVQALSHRDAL